MRSNIDRSGKVALVHYRGGIKGEDPVDDYMEGDPIRIVFGMGEVCLGMENALYEMTVGERRIIEIDPADGFGQHDPAGVQTYPRQFIPGSEGVKIGDILTWHNKGTKSKLPARVIDATPDTLTVDMNHPFAGKRLEYEVELVGIEDTPKIEDVITRL